MGVLLITCPVTGREYSSHVRTESKDSPAALADVELTAPCPYCNVEHLWRPCDARYVDTSPAPGIRRPSRRHN